MFFVDDDGTQKSLPRSFTDAADIDAFVTLAGERSAFRVEDLLALAALIDGLGADGGCKEDSAVTVRCSTLAVHTPAAAHAFWTSDISAVVGAWA